MNEHITHTPLIFSDLHAGMDKMKTSGVLVWEARKAFGIRLHDGALGFVRNGWDGK